MSNSDLVDVRPLSVTVTHPFFNWTEVAEGASGFTVAPADKDRNIKTEEEQI